MKQTIFYLVADGGDGSAYVRFFTDKEKCEELCELDPETYGCNEGGPGQFDVDGDHNIHIQTCGC